MNRGGSVFITAGDVEKSVDNVENFVISTAI
jgi:hypothetical protein